MTQRILYFGMEGVFSRAPLLELTNAHSDICAIIVPRPEQSGDAPEPIRLLVPSPLAANGLPVSHTIPVINNPPDPNIIGIGWNAGIDVYEVASLRNTITIQTIQRLKPDLIVVTCFNRLLPQSLVTNCRSLNIHPSLLPEYRGPAPLFWIFHDGLEHAGVTIHLMDENADTGDIVAQEHVRLPDGIGYRDAEIALSEHAARLLLQVLGSMANGALAHTQQPRSSAPRAPNPSAGDLVIAPAEWTARRAFNFIRGVGEANIAIGESQFAVREVVSYEETRTQGQGMIRVEDYWKIQFKDGTLICKLG